MESSAFAFLLVGTVLVDCFLEVVSEHFCVVQAERMKINLIGEMDFVFVCEVVFLVVVCL